MVSPISTNGATQSGNFSSNQRVASYTIKKGDTLKKLAQKYGMTESQFKDFANITSKTQWKTGTVLKFDMAEVPAGKGLMALARAYDMDFAKLCELNNIPKPYAQYQAKQGEKFYVCKGMKASTSKEVVARTPVPKGSVISNHTTEYVKGGYKTVKAGETHKVYSSSSKPPIPVDENNNVIAEVIKYEPTNKNGPLKGKTIMVNAGHGWGSNGKEPVFDIGTYASDSNNKQIDEWYKNRNLADPLIERLRAEGATVIYTTGKAKQVCDAEKKYNSDMLISIHHNAAGNKDVHGYQVIYHNGDDASKQFAQTMDARIDDLVSIRSKDASKAKDNCKPKADSESQHGSLGILSVATGKRPAIMIEAGFMSNETELKNIDSPKFRAQLTECIVNGIKQQFDSGYKPSTTPTMSSDDPMVKYGSKYKPEEIASKLYDLSCKYWGAVGKPDFDGLIDEINPKNVQEVLSEYTKYKENGDKESLIFTITHEVNSKQQARKDAVMKIFDALADKKGYGPDLRAVFKDELDKQFNSYGLVNTKKMDTIIQGMIDGTLEDKVDVPAELSKLIYDFADSNTAAVGKPIFTELISCISSKNAAQVITAYNNKYSESLIDTIVSEVKSDKQARMDTVMKVYDALAAQKGTPASKRKEFYDELKAQFESWGFVSTKKLDEMIDDIINGK